MNILITSASRKVGLVRAFQDALKREGGGRVVAVDASPLSAALYTADTYHIVPKLSGADFLSTILAICKKEKIDLIVPTRDEDLPFFARQKRKFTEKGVAVLVSSLETVRTCQNKKLFLQFCQENHFCFPKTFAQNALPGVRDYPLFIKPIKGKSSHKACCIASPAELKLKLREYDDVVIQEFIDAPEYSIDVFCDFTGTVVSAVPRQRICVFGGESFISKTRCHATLINESVRLAGAIKLIGPATIQCFLRNKEMLFIEINPRFGGAANLSFAAGAHAPLFIVRALRGKSIDYSLRDFKSDLIMLRYTKDLLIDGEEH